MRHLLSPILLFILLSALLPPSHQQGSEVKCDLCTTTPPPPPPVLPSPPPPSPPPPEVPSKPNCPPPPRPPKPYPPPPRRPCGPCDITIAPPGTLYPVDPSYYPGAAPVHGIPVGLMMSLVALVGFLFHHTT